MVRGKRRTEAELDRVDDLVDDNLSHIETLPKKTSRDSQKLHFKKDRF